MNKKFTALLMALLLALTLCVPAMAVSEYGVCLLYTSDAADEL